MLLGVLASSPCRTSEMVRMLAVVISYDVHHLPHCYYPPSQPLTPRSPGIDRRALSPATLSEPSISLVSSGREVGAVVHSCAGYMGKLAVSGSKQPRWRDNISGIARFRGAPTVFFLYRGACEHGRSI